MVQLVRLVHLVQIAQLLLTVQKVDVNATDAQGGTALMYACRLGAAPLILLLLKHNASPAPVDSSGMSAHTYAALYDHAHCLKLLLGRSDEAEINMHDASGRTALHWVRIRTTFMLLVGQRCLHWVRIVYPYCGALGPYSHHIPDCMHHNMD